MRLFSIIRRLKSELYLLFTRSQFKALGAHCRIHSPLKIDGKENITIGNRVVIEYKTWLAALPIEANAVAHLEIGEGTNLGHFNHIYSTQSIIIGKNVLTADRVYISDNLHSYEDISTPILKQPIKQLAHVEIGDNSWIGEGVCIIGAKIGKGCIVGANAVVTKDIPDYCVAVGTPAKIIKQYNKETKRWEKL